MKTCKSEWPELWGVAGHPHEFRHLRHLARPAKPAHVADVHLHNVYDALVHEALVVVEQTVLFAARDRNVEGRRHLRGGLQIFKGAELFKVEVI